MWAVDRPKGVFGGSRSVWGLQLPRPPSWGAAAPQNPRLILGGSRSQDPPPRPRFILVSFSLPRPSVARLPAPRHSGKM
jgi:hypothetical protein